MKSRKLHQSGFTLVELLVGLVLSFFIIAVSITYLVSSSQIFRAQSNDDLIQENARYALELLTQNIRLAGHNRIDGGVAAAAKMNIVYGDDNCPTTAIAGTAATNNSGACTGDIEVGGDNLSDRFAIDYVATSGLVCNGQAVVTGTHIATIFWSENPDGDRISSLYCQPYNIDTETFIGNAEPIIDGVDAIQVQYGVDSANNDGIVDVYQSYSEFAADLTTTSRDIRTMRVGLLLNSGVTVSEDQTEGSESRTYTLLDGDQLTFDDRILRQIFTTTVYITNRFNDGDL